MDDRVEDDPRLASLPPTGPTGLTDAEAARRRSLKMGNDAVIRTGRTYLEPPIGESMSGADADGGDVRPTLLALALLAVYASFFAVAPLREFFELTPLPWADVLGIGVLAGAWAILVMFFWRLRLVDRTRARISRLRES